MFTRDRSEMVNIYFYLDYLNKYVIVKIPKDVFHLGAEKPAEHPRRLFGCIED